MKTIKLSLVLLAFVFSANVKANGKTPTKDKGPKTIYQEVVINASIEKAWEVLGPQFVDAHKWASSISHSEALNNESLNGSTCTERGCSVKGMGDIKEKLLTYSADNRSLSYIVHDGMPKMVKSATNHWRLVDLGNGKTKLKMKIEMETQGFMGWLMGGMMKKKMTKLSSNIAQEFKYYVETGKPHPNKIKALAKAKAKA
jgi:hypothetical protein